jgi:hypothetical protein
MAYAGGRPGVPGSTVIPRGGTVNSGDATVNSVPFEVPQNAFAMTIHAPTLAGTLTIQALDPDTDLATEVWRTISAATGVTLVPLTAIAASGLAVTYRIDQIGGGVLRFVSSTSEAASPVTIKLTFHMLR